jgi:hypothetical protein
MAWISDPAEYTRVLFGFSAEYEVADIPGEILQLQLELRSLRQSLQQHLAQLQRDLAHPRDYAGADPGSQLASATPSAPHNEAAVKDRKHRITHLNKQIAERIRRIKFLRVRSQRHWYVAGLFLFLILLYILLGGRKVLPTATDKQP